jgi:hypothetical protein
MIQLSSTILKQCPRVVRGIVDNISNKIPSRVSSTDLSYSWTKSHFNVKRIISQWNAYVESTRQDKSPTRRVVRPSKWPRPQHRAGLTPFQRGVIQLGKRKVPATAVHLELCLNSPMKSTRSTWCGIASATLKSRLILVVVTSTCSHSISRTIVHLLVYFKTFSTVLVYPRVYHPQRDTFLPENGRADFNIH